MSKKTNKQLTIYTQTECGYCKDAKKVLKDNKIKFIEKNTENSDEFQNITNAIGISLTPTLVYGEDIIVASRDFEDPESIPYVLKAYDNINYKKDFLTFERLKTFELNTQEALEYIANVLTEFKEFKDSLEIKNPNS